MTVTLSQVTVTLEVTVTSNDVAICSSLQSDRHFWKFSKNFFYSKWCKIAQNGKIQQKKFSKILRCDGHLKWRHSKWPWPSARHFKVTVTFERVTVTSLKWRADGQSHCLNHAWILLLFFNFEVIVFDMYFLPPFSGRPLLFVKIKRWEQS